MQHFTNVETLGTEYTVTDTKGKFLKTIQIIPQEEIISAALEQEFQELLDDALGPYEKCKTDVKDMETYMIESVAVLEGFDKVDPYRVLWHATTEDEVDLPKLIEYAIKNGYDKIILEHIAESN